MKTLFAVIALVACTSVQANVGAQPVKASAQPAWVKDMEVIHCSSGDCYNYKTRMQYFDYDGPEGITVAFPIEKYPRKSRL